MKLKDIYKANQCTDLQDVNIAIEQTRALITVGESKAKFKRLTSLINRKRVLTEKQK